MEVTKNPTVTLTQLQQSSAEMGAPDRRAFKQYFFSQALNGIAQHLINTIPTVEVLLGQYHAMGESQWQK